MLVDLHFVAPDCLPEFGGTAVFVPIVAEVFSKSLGQYDLDCILFVGLFPVLAGSHKFLESLWLPLLPKQELVLELIAPLVQRTLDSTEVDVHFVCLFRLR